MRGFLKKNRCETGTPVFRIETTTDLDEGTMRRNRVSFLSCLDDLNVFKNEMNVNFRSFEACIKKDRILSCSLPVLLLNRLLLLDHKVCEVLGNSTS